MAGWGSGPWGSGPWGSGADQLRLQGALAVRENVVRLTFNQPVLLTGLLDPSDASSGDRYSVAPVVGTVGLDGLQARQVSPVRAVYSPVQGAQGAQLDLAVDRAFSPYAAEYLVAVNGLRSLAGTLLDPAATSARFWGLRRGLPVLTPDRVVERRDIANPQVLQGLLLGPPPTELATFPVDDSGDYAADAGLVSYKKRIFRRLTTRRGRFAHLPDYGIGLPAQVKRLAQPALRQVLVAEAEEQIGREPETAAVAVQLVQRPEDPGVWELRVRARMRTGDEVLLDVPIVPGG